MALPSDLVKIPAKFQDPLGTLGSFRKDIKKQPVGKGRGVGHNVCTVQVELVLREMEWARAIKFALHR